MYWFCAGLSVGATIVIVLAWVYSISTERREEDDDDNED
jgi:hypothetical protein